MDENKDLEVQKEEVVVEGQTQENNEPQYTEDEQAAMARGWKPKDEWDGPEDEWKPAKAFNEYGKLKDALSEKERDVKKLNKVVQLMKDHHTRVRQSAYEDAVKTLKAEKAAALKEEDFAKAEEIRDKIDDIRYRAANDKPLPDHIEREIEEQTTEPDPAFFEFLDRNPWYKPGGTDSLSKEADALGFAIAQSNPDWEFSQVIAKVERDMKKLHPEKFATPRQVVNEPGARGAPARAKEGVVKLTDEQRAVARAFDMTDAEYAKQLDSYKGR